MIKRIIIFLLIIILTLLPVVCSGADRWRKEDTARQLIMTAIVTMDYKQTLDITRSPNHTERNPFLGEYPSKKKVRYLIPLALAGHTAVAYMLPHKYREIWQGVGIGVESWAVGSNDNNGLEQSEYGVDAGFTYTIEF